MAKIKFKIGDEVKEELFHVEFQANNDRNMAQRMLRYSLDIFDRFGDFPSQIVVYVGREPLKMNNDFIYSRTFSNLRFQFKLVDITNIPSEKFLEIENPDLALLAILGKTEDIEEILNKILLIIKKNSDSTEELIVSITKLKFVSQLRGISYLVYKKGIDLLGVDIRKLESYKLGKKEGIEEGERKALIGTILSIVEKKLGLDKGQLKEIKKALEKIDDLEKLKSLVPEILEISSIKELKEKISKK